MASDKNETSKGTIAVYQSEDGKIRIDAKLENETVWLTQAQMAELFQSSKANINEHISRIFEEGELEEDSTVRNFRTVATNDKTYNMKYYNLDMIISVGYRVKSRVAVKFRKWATQTLKEYLIRGYAINERRISEQQQQLEALKTAIDLIERGIVNQIEDITQVKQLTAFLHRFAMGLEMLDDYDHERLDTSGNSKVEHSEIGSDEISSAEFLKVAETMKTEFSSDIFGVPKDESFESSVRQIYQTFGGKDCYETLEEKAAMLLYLVVKNHSFIDGNKRIAASLFLYFLERNKILKKKDGTAKIDNNTLFALTILTAESKPAEMEKIKKIIITILNRNI